VATFNQGMSQPKGRISKCNGELRAKTATFINWNIVVYKIFAAVIQISI